MNKITANLQNTMGTKYVYQSTLKVEKNQGIPKYPAVVN
jgi:hypothetical protein